MRLISCCESLPMLDSLGGMSISYKKSRHCAVLESKIGGRLSKGGQDHIFPKFGHARHRPINLSTSRKSETSLETGSLCVETFMVFAGLRFLPRVVGMRGCWIWNFAGIKIRAQCIYAKEDFFWICKFFTLRKCADLWGFCIKRMIINLLRCSFAVCLKLKKKEKKCWRANMQNSYSNSYK